MDGFEEINAAEDQYVAHGKPVLGRAFELLYERWRRGKRDRETALRLLFLSWYSCSEPGWLTGLDARSLPGLVDEVFDSLGGENSGDEEVWFVVHVMSDVAPWCFGGARRERTWVEIAADFSAKLGDRISRMDPDRFAGRGAYGEYFAHQARTHFVHGAEDG